MAKIGIAAAIVMLSALVASIYGVSGFAILICLKLLL